MVSESGSAGCFWENWKHRIAVCRESSVGKALEKQECRVGICTAGNYFDVYDASGCVVSLMVSDDELEQYMKYVNGFDFAM